MKPNQRLMNALPALTVVLVLALFVGEWAYQSAPAVVAEVRK